MLDLLGTLTFTLQVICSTCSPTLVAETWVSSLLILISDFVCVRLASLCNRVWWCFVHFLHISGAQHFSTGVLSLSSSYRDLQHNSRMMLILSACMHPLNTLQVCTVCIWWPHFLHATHVLAVDAAKDCFTDIVGSGPDTCLCPAWEAPSRCVAWSSRNFKNSVHSGTPSLLLLYSTHFNCVLLSSFCWRMTVSTVLFEWIVVCCL